MSDAVKYDVRNQVAWATLNRPKVLNATNKDMMQRLLEVVDKVSEDSNVRVLVITGAGRAFSAGGDIQEMADAAGGDARKNQRYYQNILQ